MHLFNLNASDLYRKCEVFSSMGPEVQGFLNAIGIFKYNNYIIEKMSDIVISVDQTLLFFIYQILHIMTTIPKNA